MRIWLSGYLIIWLLATGAGAQSGANGEFFIVSSVNPEKHQVLVKQPTEVTQVLRVDGQTRYLDRAGKAIGLSDLRAGDTIFIVMRAGSDVALEVRKGPMTVAELQRRYLK